MDYRNLEGVYDKVISIEMLEAVGHKFYDTYFKKINEVLAPKGLIGLQVITSPHSRFKEFKRELIDSKTYFYDHSSFSTYNEPIIS